MIGQWSNGDKWSDRAAGQQMGISLRYTIGQLGLGGAFQKTFGANDSDKRQQVWNLSASYQFEVVKVFAGYFNGKDQTNWVNGIMGRAVDNNSTLDRKDNGYFLGASWQATPRWTITGAAYYDQPRTSWSTATRASATL